MGRVRTGGRVAPLTKKGTTRRGGLEKVIGEPHDFVDDEKKGKVL